MADDPYDAARLSQQHTARKWRRRRTRPEIQADTDPRAMRLDTGSDTQRRGHAAEQRAREFLESRGLQIIAANLRCRAGEVDLVARSARTLVFVEVRQRTSARYGGAAASVNRSKQARLIRVARYYLPQLARCCFAGQVPACRFDVVAIEGTEIRWIRSAFETPDV